MAGHTTGVQVDLRRWVLRVSTSMQECFSAVAVSPPTVPVETEETKFPLPLCNNDE